MSMVGMVAPAYSAVLELKRVFLSSGGVGYLEYEAQVDGPTELSLEVPLQQVDDVLKSLAIYDDQGNVGSVTLPGREPLEQVFRNLPFGAAALESPVALLNTLQGAEVEVSGPRQLQGRLLKVTEETVVLPNHLGSTTRHRVSVITPEGLQQMILEDLEGLRFADPELQKQVQEALGAISAYRAKARRTLQIRVDGEGRRAVRAGYVVEAPLWKVSYRLSLEPSLSPTEPSQSRLQGWALLENMSGHDWQGVELTLASGNPVTFRQALYQAYYVERPEVPVEVLGRVLPPPDTGTVATAAAPAPPALAAEKFAADVRAETARERMLTRGMIAEPAAAPAMAAPTHEVAGEEAAEQVLFAFPLPVNVKSGHSLMLPIIDREIPALRVALFQPSVQAAHPLASVQLTNASETSLPPGIITLYQHHGYLGDGRITALPAGDKRLVSFAVDAKVRIRRDEALTRTLTQGKISKGVFQLTTLERQSTTYHLKGVQPEDRLLWIEHPRQAGWDLAMPDARGVELTAEHYRIPYVLQQGAEADLTVVLQRPVRQELLLLRLGLDQIQAYAESAELDESIRRAFSEMAQQRAQIDALEREIGRLEQQREATFNDQARLRDNLSRVPENSDLARRYLQKLSAQEDEIEALDGKLQNARNSLETLRQKLADYVHGLAL
jgi:hypothetical protein